MLIKDSPKIWSVWQVEIESLTLFIIARNKNTTYLTSRVFNLLARQYRDYFRYGDYGSKMSFYRGYLN